MRNRRNDIDFKIDVEATRERVVFMKMTLTNNSPNDYYISRSAILLDGFKGKTFSVEGPSKIICPFHTGFYPKSDLIEFRSTQSLSNSLEISRACQFQWATPGVYTVFIRDAFSLYTDSNKDSHHTSEKLGGDSEEYSWLIANSSFIIGEARADSASASSVGDDSL